jgi:hypothetical protein
VEDKDGQIILIEDKIRYSTKDSTILDELDINGRVIEDTCVFTSRDHATIIDPLEFLGITGSGTLSVPKVLQMPGNGYIGLAPHTNYKDYNFMYNLKENG